jgi:LPS export ABC transporter protein LptC
VNPIGAGERNFAKRSAPGAVSLLRLAAVAAATAVVALACTDPGVRPTTTGVIQSADTADEVLMGMSHYITDNGVRRSLVEADTAYIYDASQTAELRKAKVTFFDAAGKETSTITADEGTYLIRDGTMHARGNVVATTPDGRHLNTEVLDYEPRTNAISSDRPFVYTNASERLEGNGFRSDPDFKNVVAQQPRGGQKAPRPGKPDSTHGGILLPGQ